MIKRQAKKGTNFEGTLWPLLGALSILVVGTTFMMVNSRQTQDIRTNAARRIDSPASIGLYETGVKLGDWVHFDYTLPKGVKEDPAGSGTQARVQVMCYQNNELVYGMADNAINVKVGASGMQLGGGSSLWLSRGGEANCTAKLYQWSYKGGTQQFIPFAETSFSASGI